MTKDESKRSFIIGDKWLYYKIYTGTKTADYLLTQIIKPLTEDLLQKQIIDQWFFIRYADPDQHLRVRFHCAETQNIGKVIDQLYPLLNKYQQEELIWKIQTDTYHRELERYGKNAIQDAEKYFYYDSKMIVDFLNLIEGAEGEELRWLFGIKAIDRLLDDFGYDMHRKEQLLEALKRAFGTEFKVDKAVKLQLDKKFRTERQKINWVLNLDVQNSADYAPIMEVLNTKSMAMPTIVANIISKTPENNLDNVIGSYTHMLMNRLFRSKNRMHEMVLYYLMHKTYKSHLGAIKHRKK